MNFRGHLIFAVSLLGLGLYVSKKYFNFGLGPLLIYFPCFLVGAIFADKIEIPSSREHRGFLHSRKMFWLTLLILIPITIQKGLDSNTYWFFGTSFLAGHLTHLVGDALTSPLPA